MGVKQTLHYGVAVRDENANESASPTKVVFAQRVSIKCD